MKWQKFEENSFKEELIIQVKSNKIPRFENFLLWYRLHNTKTVASSDEIPIPAGETSTSALFSKFGGSLFGTTGSPQKVVTNIRGFLTNRFTGTIIPAIPSVSDTGMWKKKNQI